MDESYTAERHWLHITGQPHGRTSTHFFLLVTYMYVRGSVLDGVAIRYMHALPVLWMMSRFRIIMCAPR